MRRRTPCRTAHFPQGYRIPLQRWWTRGSLPIAEVKHAGLRSSIGVHAQGVVILPGDVKVLRLAQNRRRSERLAEIPRRFILGGIPSIGDFDSGRSHGNTFVVAGRGYNHAETPILVHNRNPIAGQVNRRGGFGGALRRRRPAPPPPPPLFPPGQREAPPHSPR